MADCYACGGWGRLVTPMDARDYGASESASYDVPLISLCMVCFGSGEGRMKPKAESVDSEAPEMVDNPN
jgi:hypothetical protein